MLTFAGKNRIMEFRTKVELPIGNEKIHHSDRLMLWGSCFAENIGKLLNEYKFACDLNPFGILYNPASIAKAVKTLQEKRLYTEADLLWDKNSWHSLMHHSLFSDAEKETCLSNINSRITQGNENLMQANWLIFTWGTARVYEWKETGEIVGNCHKLPEKLFTRRLLEVDEIVSTYSQLLADLHSQNHGLKVLFTVSPIRHAKDGMHGNQLNKATLLLAVEKLCQALPFCFYFPSYEIMMDELRDYRFYADDMLHPSGLAINYIWLCFKNSFFGLETLQFMKQWDEVKKALAHRPFNPQSEGYQSFLSQILLKIERLKEKFPYLDAQNEETLCQTLLKK